ncbi:HNH endonuclease signature motif containing protein [Microbacterium sp. VKM Ac-2923]|uniref:HNH endonuclease signature motif containing protein n=1 Tax=Microbacterium sp. VKM Ac-2923 TaxID=2929476 RepID=UPI001FB2A7C1|nr:HNH endonuclease signature motif containing protein [Microbacterium sp. VKM Ac-2923]MCJ1708028.1 HNH endonuclease [Microbacterium sp. VKM Ac-2923]
MDPTAPPSHRAQPVCTAWGVPWPSDDELRADAETAWAVEVGLIDPDVRGAGAIGDEPWALVDPAPPENGSPLTQTRSENAAPSPGEPVPAEAGPEALLRELEHQARARQRATAEEYRLIRLVLEQSATDPVPWVGSDPTLDMAWTDSRGRTTAAVRRDRRDMAERAAVAEIATRLLLSEQTVRIRAAHADVLQTRCPDVWAAFAEGRISERHAVDSARLATSLPEADASTTAASIASSDESGFGSGEDPSAPDDLVAGGPAGSTEAVPSADSPFEEHESWRAFDEGALDRALRLPPARFAVAARSLRERVHSESLEARHQRATRDRGVWLTAELDGMATLSALLPADRASAAMARVDRAARHLRVAPDEERTLAQLRADVFADFLTTPPASAATSASESHASVTGGSVTGGPVSGGSATCTSAGGGRAAGGPETCVSVAGGASAGSSAGGGAATGGPEAGGMSSCGSVAGGSPARASGAGASPIPATPASTRRAAVVITVPALTLLGAGAEPAVLDGYGPIDLDTARRLAGEATSWVRVLTHPLTDVPLALDRTTYRVPTALRRWLGVTSPTCTFPGCGRSARDYDLDHLSAWIDGGRTDDDNLAPECRHHHRLRHESRWHPSRDPDTGDLRWTSPLGAQIAEDPPPF